jgi:Ca-activated chloride channel family protein
LPVTVENRDGGLVADLAQDRFVVYDEGKRQDVQFFSDKDAPVSVAWVIDSSYSMRARIRQVVAASLRFASLSQADDELFIIHFNDFPQHLFESRGVAASDAPVLERGLSEIIPEGRTALYDALLAGMDRLEKTARARKAMILVSDGDDTASYAKRDDVLERARRSNVTIYTIGFSGDLDNWRDSNPGVLRTLASASGGKRFLASSAGPLLQAAERIAREIRSSYTLSFTPRQRDGKFHRLRVEVSGGDRERFVVRTRPGYVAALDKSR